MAIGTYVAGVTDTAGTTYYGAPYTVGWGFTVSDSVLLKSVIIHFNSPGSYSSTVWITNSSSTVLSTVSMNQSVGVGDTEFAMPNAALNPGQTYWINVYNGGASTASGNPSVATLGTTPATYESVPTGKPLTRTTSGRYAAGQAGVQNGSSDSYIVRAKLSFNLNNVAPTAPTNVVVTNSPVPNGTMPNVTWTFNDPDAGDAQTRYEIRWRKKD